MSYANLATKKGRVGLSGLWEEKSDLAPEQD